MFRLGEESTVRLRARSAVLYLFRPLPVRSITLARHGAQAPLRRVKAHMVNKQAEPNNHAA